MPRKSKLDIRQCGELEPPIYARQHEIGKDIYGKTRRVGAILYDPRLYPDCLVIRCKWQTSRGIFEEKYPYEVLNIQPESIRHDSLT